MLCTAGVENPDSILKHLADLMRPMLINSLKERRKKIFTENADRMKRLMDDLQKKLDEVGPKCFNYSFIFLDNQCISCVTRFNGFPFGSRF